jgi:hypothetical protein
VLDVPRNGAGNFDIGVRVMLDKIALPGVGKINV